MSGCWAWMSEHWILTFIMFLVLMGTVETIALSIIKRSKKGNSEK